MIIKSHEIGKDENFKIWHASDMNMLLYMHSDGGSIVCGDSSYPIVRGALCFVGQGRYHYTMPEPAESYDRSKIFFSSKLLRGVQELLTEGGAFLRFSPESLVYALLPEEAQCEADAIFEERSRLEGRYREAVSVAQLLRLLVLADKYSIEGKKQSVGALSGAVDYINRNIFRDIDIDEICSEIHLSKYHFCRRFKSTMGMTVMEYILKTRIFLARNMLEKESLSVTEVSERCGFSSVSYFCRVFRVDTGMSPLKYRRLHSER